MLSNGISFDPRKVEALILQDLPTSMQSLVRFVYKLSYLSRSFGMLVEYIYPLQKAKQADPFRWVEVEDVSF